MSARSTLLIAVLVGVMAPPAAMAQISPTTFKGFLCGIDLAENGLPIPPSLASKAGTAVTGNTEKLCANGAQGGNIRLTCRTTIADWAGGAVSLQGVPCQISGQQCNVSANVPASLSSLTIDAAGNTVLFCQARAPGAG